MTKFVAVSTFWFFPKPTIFFLMIIFVADSTWRIISFLLYIFFICPIFGSISSSRKFFKLLFFFIFLRSNIEFRSECSFYKTFIPTTQSFLISF
ncbi:hypothetical protein RchiOBHm_Chr6g0260301 [Rosa chinensis]|uniref:Uncharacterized protein n=1 Tax=Rosa chinensis TaxID=74649 RepID=A0A2P6PN23_ROSCH|nr:hypothetical protein RchiOBHm_Chr6g0260301 [Rosa chinensis]